MALRNLVEENLYGIDNYNVYFGLYALFFSEFMRVFLGPIVSRISIIIFQIFIPSINGKPKKEPSELLRDRETRKAANMLPSRSKYEREAAIVDETFEAAVEEAKQYKSYLDDRKANVANESDLYMLLTHGYKKYRFVSTSFLKRNKLGKYKITS